MTQWSCVKIEAMHCQATTLGKLFIPACLASCRGLALAYLAAVCETAVSVLIVTAIAIYSLEHGLLHLSCNACQLSLLPSVGQ